MTLLALETSLRRGGVALVTPDGETLTRRLDPDARHARDLMPAVDELLAEHGGPSALDAVLIGTGPGSYTGLRVGIATALGIARGAGAAIVGVPSYDALVFGAAGPGEEALVLADARAGAAYVGRYRRTADDVVALEGPSVVPLEGVLAAAADPGLVFAEPELLERVGLATLVPLGPVAPDVADTLALGRLRLEREGPHAPADVAPLYLRPFAPATRRR